MDACYLTEQEQETIRYYNLHAQDWSDRRKKTTEPSFWDEELKILKALQPPPCILLELGSGSGRESLELTSLGYDYVGIDVSANLLNIAQNTNLLGRFVLSTAYELPFASQTFDAFFSWALLPHVPKERLPHALSCLKTTLKPNAVGFFAMREGSGYTQEVSTGRWFSYYSQEELSIMLHKQGFKIEKAYKKTSRPDLTWLIFFVRLLPSQGII